MYMRKNIKSNMTLFSVESTTFFFWVHKTSFNQWSRSHHDYSILAPLGSSAAYVSLTLTTWYINSSSAYSPLKGHLSALIASITNYYTSLLVIWKKTALFSTESASQKIFYAQDACEVMPIIWESIHVPLVSFSVFNKDSRKLYNIIVGTGTDLVSNYQYESLSILIIFAQPNYRRNME